MTADKTSESRLFKVTFGVPIRGKISKKLTVAVDDRFYMDTNGIQEYTGRKDEARDKSLDVLEELGRVRGLEEAAAIKKGVDTAEVDPEKWGVLTKDWAPPKGTATNVKAALKADRCPELDEPLYLNTGDKTPTGPIWPMVIEKAWAAFLPKVGHWHASVGTPPLPQMATAHRPLAFTLPLHLQPPLPSVYRLPLPCSRHLSIGL